MDCILQHYTCSCVELHSPPYFIRDQLCLPFELVFMMLVLSAALVSPSHSNSHFYVLLSDIKKNEVGSSLHILVYSPLQAMLREYGGDVPERLLQRLVAAFAELREMADDGLIAYPYSTREVVAIVRHLQVC